MRTLTHHIRIVRAVLLTAVFSAVLVSPLTAQESSSMKPSAVPKLDFGDYTSAVLMQKTWGAFDAKDYYRTIIYASKIVELYGGVASQMQASLSEYPSGSNEDVFKYWALNDVGTALFVLGEAYRKSGKKEEAIKVFERIVKEFGYAQCWDGRGWFWKVAMVAQDKLAMADAGADMDFDNYDSNTMVQKTWAAFNKKDWDSVIIYVKKLEDLYGDKAREMQRTMKGYRDDSWKRDRTSFNYWALNDVGTGVFILAETYLKMGRKQEAREAYSRVVNDFYYAQCWDRQGWFWRPSEVAQKRLNDNRL